MQTPRKERVRYRRHERQMNAIRIMPWWEYEELLSKAETIIQNLLNRVWEKEEVK